MTFRLRNYQRRLIDDAEECVASGGVPCIVLSTGGGKTVILSDLTKSALARGERVVLMAHRGEIISQIVASLRQHLGPRVRIESIRAGSRSRYAADVTVGMVQTLTRRVHQLTPLRGCTLFVDEAHHLCSRTWQNVVAALSPARLIGATATPITPTGRGLGDTTQITHLLLGPQVRELIEMGSLAPYRLFAAPKQMDTKGLRKVAGDFARADMEQRVCAIDGEVVPTWRRLADGLPTLSIAVSVDHAHHVAAQYNEAGIPAAAVDGKTPQGIRERMFDDFRSGKLLVLASACVVEEGLDICAATVLQQLRPTASLRLYRQLVGRVLRPSPGKEHAVLLDHVGNYSRLPLPCADIDWQLNVPATATGPQRRAEVDPITNEVTLAPVEVVESQEQLQEITPELLERSTPAKARRLLNERAMAEIRGGNAAVLRPWLQRTAVLEEATLAALEQALGMPPNWARTQAMLNGWKAPQRRNAETRLAAASYSR